MRSNVIEQVPRGANSFLDVAQNIFARIELRFLRKVADPDSVCRPGFPEEILNDARHDLQQRAFAGSVGADQPDFCSREK